MAKRGIPFLFASYPQSFFPLFFSLCSSFCFKFLIILSERFSSVHAKAAIAYSRKLIMRVLLVGFYCPILTLSMRAFGPRISAYAFWTTTDIHTYQHISREISIEHPSVGLASLAQLYVCLSWSKKRRRNHVGQTRACSKSVLGGKIRPVTHPYYSF